MESGEEVVVVRAEMQPLVLETMTKFDDNEQVCQLPPWSDLHCCQHWIESDTRTKTLV